ncbi:MAG: ubiquinol-cytochrome c reductase iron-sulfur subunit [Thermoanaerobaculia bacterium]
MTASPETSRRRFLSWFLGTSVGALLASVVYPVVAFLRPPIIPEASTNQVDAGPVNDPELLSSGFKIVRFGNDPVIVVRAGEGDFRAFAATCTHLDCIVEYRSAEHVLWCNCHNGVYDLQGRNIGGPPPRPLAPYAVHVVPGERGAPDTLVVETV